MSTFSSSNFYSTLTLIPSPQELSHLITNPYISNDQVDRKFKNKPTSSAILCYYTFISHSIAELEEELERHQQECEVLYDNLFASWTFHYRIRPIIGEYRHCRAMEWQGHHPYSCRTSPSTSSTNSTPSSKEFPPVQLPSPKIKQTTSPSPINSLSHEEILRVMSIKIHQYSDNNSFSSKEQLIMVEDTNEENTLPAPSWVQNGQEVPCTCCDQIGHCRKDCNTPLKTHGFCETCLWEWRHGDCPHFQFPKPAFVKWTNAAIALQNQREWQV